MNLLDPQVYLRLTPQGLAVYRDLGLTDYVGLVNIHDLRRAVYAQDDKLVGFLVGNDPGPYWLSSKSSL
jgi:hypothetical protein